MGDGNVERVDSLVPPSFLLLLVVKIAGCSLARAAVLTGMTAASLSTRILRTWYVNFRERDSLTANIEMLPGPIYCLHWAAEVLR